MNVENITNLIKEKLITLENNPNLLGAGGRTKSKEGVMVRRARNLVTIEITLPIKVEFGEGDTDES